MKLISSSQAVDDHTCRADDHGWEHDAETHFSFADAVVADGQTCRQAIRAVGEWQGKAVADEVCDCDQATAGLVKLSADVTSRIR